MAPTLTLTITLLWYTPISWISCGFFDPPNAANLLVNSVTECEMALSVNKIAIKIYNSATVFHAMCSVCRSFCVNCTCKKINAYSPHEWFHWRMIPLMIRLFWVLGNIRSSTSSLERIGLWWTACGRASSSKCVAKWFHWRQHYELGDDTTHLGSHNTLCHRFQGIYHVLPLRANITRMGCFREGQFGVSWRCSL